MRYVIPEFKTIGIGDRIIVVETHSHYRDEYFMGRVISRTPTRLTVQYPSGQAKFTIDGNEFPFNYRGRRIVEALSENVERARKSNAIRVFKRATWALESSLRSPQWDAISTEQLMNMATTIEVAALSLAKKDE